MKKSISAVSFVFALMLFLLLTVNTAYGDWKGGHDAPGWSEPARAAYFAEGTTRNGFEEYLHLRNPGLEGSTVVVSYLFPAPAAPQEQTFALAPGSGASILVNDVVGPGRDVSVVVSAEPGVISERQVYFNYKGVWTGGHVTSGTGAPSETWYFAEGTTRERFQEWLCLQNPGSVDTTVDVTYMLGTGENLEQTIVLGSNNRETVSVNDVIGPGQDVSVLIEADSPIVAERPMYFDYKSAWRGGHTITGAIAPADDWYFAEGTTRTGFEEWLCLMNPGGETTASVEYMFSDGEAFSRDYTLRARSRTTVFVNTEVGPERDVSVRVRSKDDIVCERPMYFFYGSDYEGGHVVLGSNSGKETWHFATTAAGSRFDSWLCVMNPGDETNTGVVAVRDGQGASSNEQPLSMEPRTRSTLDLNVLSQGLEEAWIEITFSSEVIVERPSYFSYEPSVDPEPFTFAIWNGMELKSPVRYSDLLGCVFHEAGTTGSDGKPDNVQVMQPVGICLLDDNPSRLHPAISKFVGSDPAYFIEETRYRGTYSTTACDVMAKKGSPVLAPVSGTVLAAESYLLYGKYPDLRVRILIDGAPGYHMAVLHMDTLSVSKGQRVEAGRTVLGTVRDLVPYFRSGPDPYTREDGNHPHVQINYRPDMHL